MWSGFAFEIKLKIRFKIKKANELPAPVGEGLGWGQYSEVKAEALGK